MAGKKMSVSRAFCLLYIAFGLQANAHPTLFFNGKIATLDVANPDADTMVTENGKILFVGAKSEATKFLHVDSPKIDLKQRRVLPGFIEAHSHFFGIGLAKMQLDLNGKRSSSEIVAQVALEVKSLPKGSWIKGRGWDQNLWEKKVFPTHLELSEVAPSHPVVLTRVDGHAIWCNALAMKLAGVDRNTQAPKGGQIIKDEKGNPTGIFIDAAADLVSNHIPKPNETQIAKAAQLAQNEAFRFGVTSFQDAGIEQFDIDNYEKLYASKKLKLRIYAMLAGSNQGLLNRYFKIGPQIALFDNHLTIRSVKLYADGALGSRGAALLQPYSDDAGNFGLVITEPDKIADISRRALLKGFQIATHAIGDRANRLVLDTYQDAFGAAKLAEARFRIEHAQIVDPSDVPRFAKLGVIASMQPTHCTSDSPWVPARLGDARSQSSAYMWRSFLNAKVTLAFGADAPVESLNPMLGLYAAVTRKSLGASSNAPFYPTQSLTLSEALNAFTSGAAYAAFEENEKGKLKRGYLADFIVLDKDILALEPKALLETTVLETYIGGERVYGKSNL